MDVRWWKLVELFQSYYCCGGVHLSPRSLSLFHSHGDENSMESPESRQFLDNFHSRPSRLPLFSLSLYDMELFWRSLKLRIEWKFYWNSWYATQSFSPSDFLGFTLWIFCISCSEKPSKDIFSFDFGAKISSKIADPQQQKKVTFDVV